MPWSVKQDHPDCEASKPWAVVKGSDGSVAGCHETQADAEQQVKALYANEGDMAELPPPMEAAPRWRMLAVDESRPTDDGRAFRGEGVLTWREPPFALTWTDQITDGHLGAKLGGVVDRVERQGPQVWFYGTFTDDESGMELLSHIRAGHPLFPSVTIADDLAVLEVDDLGREQLVFEQGKLIGNTLTPEQAQEGTFIELDEEPAAVEPVPVMACADAGGPPLYPSRSWFERPDELDEGVTPLTITDEGRIYFHLAGETCLLSRPDRCYRVRDEQLARDFSFAHKGREGHGRGIKTAEGEYVKVGQLLLPGGHAPIRADAYTAMRFYDNTDHAIGHVRFGWDEKNNLPYGAGALRPGTTEAQVQMARAVGSVSGDWRPGDQLDADPGKVYLIAAPIVNVPGFPPVKALVASGEVRVLIARGPGGGPRLPDPEHVTAFQQGNIEPMMEWYCAGADGQIDWGTSGDFEQCVAIASGHLEDPQAFCQTLHQRCVGTPSGEHAVAASAALAALALERMDAQVWGPQLAEMDRRVGA